MAEGDEDAERSADATDAADAGNDRAGDAAESGDERADADWFEQALAGDQTTASGDASPDAGRSWDADGAEPGSGGNAGSAERGSGASQSSADEPGGEPEDDLFGESFADALAGSGDAADSGATEGPPPSADFDPEDLDSDIPRISLGVDGLDEMIQGGVPERSLIVGMGGPGTGKTTFGLQFLDAALSRGERAVFITLEEDRDRILATAAEKGWDFPTYAERGDLAILDLDPVEMANSLASIRSELPALIDEFGASRLVLDSVSLLEMMYDDQAVRRTEVYDFTRALKRAGVTTYLTSEASADNPYASRHGIIEYLTDAVLVFRYVRPDDYQETRLAVEIQKIRDANHSRETKPYEITNEGINVYRQANIF